jgi:Transposase DDE domain
MNQSRPLYDTSPALALLDPWLRRHLPTLDPAVTRRLIQLVTGIFEQQSLLIEAIADASVFTGTDSSNATQVRRIVRDSRITLAEVYYPFLRQVLATLPGSLFYLTLDETSHASDYCVVQGGLATDAISLPLGYFLYAPDAPWAEDARTLLSAIDELFPTERTLVLLADRVHTGEPLLGCLDALGWYYVFRAAQDTWMEHPTLGWRQLRKLYRQANTARFFQNVRIWKGGTRRTNVSLVKLARKGFRPTTWYVVSDLPASKQRFAEYACRWWQECLFKDCKSAMFDWERGRVTKTERVYVLLIGFGCACWALWLLGRRHEHVPKRKATTKAAQQRRRNVLKQGAKTFVTATKPGQRLTLAALPAPRVLDYPRVFSVAQTTELK